MEDGDVGHRWCGGDGVVPLTRSFMEQLFGTLRRDFATLKQEIAAEVKELKQEVVELGQWIDTLEQAQDAREEELDCHKRDLLTLQDKNQELQYRIEDLENRRQDGGWWSSNQPDGTQNSREEQIFAQFERFYSNLYMAEELNYEVVEDYLTSVPLTRISLAASEMLDGDITISEVLVAIQRLPSGKAPGADGFSADYYKSFGSLLAPILAWLYNRQGVAAPLSPTM
ncbi:hypothetical protein NDU88_006069 [Pleurodeles waltl]|uniref:Uncharacterized protein n=1 Tax=Pleurodeles waltl TaxID=8319 RepID=A0AAV7TCA7_PLEWA|nr:hypothetical protein NDU88_006069 [Pleurodeles waltl]